MARILMCCMILFVSMQSPAQCPYISGALMDAVGTGTPAGEAKNEFLVFQTGASALAVNAFSVGYGTTSAALDFTINGAAVTWQSLPASPLISNSAGTITNITTGSIPPNTPVVLLNAGYSVPYDFASFGPSVYVLVYSVGTGLSGFSASGNFANKSAPSSLRYFRITTGSCNNVVSYDKNAAAFSASDGAGAKWDASGAIRFANTGGSGAVLPLGVLDFGVRPDADRALLYWRNAAHSGIRLFELHKSDDGVSFRTIARIPVAEPFAPNPQEYTYNDPADTAAIVYYRLFGFDSCGFSEYTETLPLRKDMRRSLCRVYPNPVTDFLKIETDSRLLHVCVRNAYGQICLDREGDERLFDLRAFPPGLYLLYLQMASGREYFQLLKE